MMFVIYVVTCLLIGIITVFVSLKIYDKSKVKLRGMQTDDNSSSSFKVMNWLVRLGVDIDTYRNNCIFVNKKPDYSTYLIALIFAVIAIVVGLVSSCLGQYIIGSLFILFGTAAYFSTKKLDADVKSKKERIKNDIPRFLDLFVTALKVGMPTPNAIRITAESVDCDLSEQLLICLRDSDLKSNEWTDELTDLSRRLEISELSTFTLSLNNSYIRGTDIVSDMQNLSETMGRERLLDYKDKASKAENTIMIPIFLCKLVPLIVFLLIPVLFKLMGSII